VPGTLTASDVVVSRGRIPVLDGVSLVVASGHRLGVVGPNGAGKSTLLRVLAGELQPDGGRVTLSPPTLNVGHLAQETSAPPGETVRASLARRTGASAAAAGLERAAAGLAAGGTGAADAYADALDRYLSLGAADIDARATEVCADIGLDPARLDTEMAALSGGQRARAGVAAILLSRFDVFLLDEPTNDLDFAGLDRLEAFVESLPGGVVIVSHDRRFLDRTVTEVLELDAHTHRATAYGGGWGRYLEARDVVRQQASARYSAYVAARGELVDRVRAQRQWASVGVRKEKGAPRDNDKAQRKFRINNTEHLAAKVRISEKRLSRLEDDAVDKPWEPWELRLTFGGSRRSGDVVARLDGGVIARPGWSLGPVDLEIGWAERVAVTGPNGAGKSTLLGALTGTVELTGGHRWIGPGVVVGTLDQARRPFSGPLINAFASASGLPPGDARSLLAKFGLGAGHVARPVETLSPGERTRAVLALLMASEVNCLVLDEPTNHLDMPAIEELELALDRYEGTLLLVTHDRELLDRVEITRTVSVSRSGTVMDEERESVPRAGPGTV
jgi:ATPase subunit of ABC transporter with duplicated ATPase domains